MGYEYISRNHNEIRTWNLIMIRHIVFFNAKNETDKDVIYDGLSLLSNIPHCNFFEVQKDINADALSSGQVDFIVYGEFEDLEQLDAYKAHPLYQKSIDIVRPLRDVRIAGDFLSAA